MPRYYCDYCDTYLTHDSPSVRKQHNAGYKHKANVRTYYQQFEEQQTQSLIDQRIKEHIGQAAAFQQVGAAYGQLAALPGQRPRLPVLPTPVLPIPGAAPTPLVPGIRPPVLPRPISGAPGYAAVLTIPPSVAPPGAPVAPMQPNGLPRPPAVSGGLAVPSSNGIPSAIPQAIYQGNPTATTASAASSATASADSFSYAQAPDTAH
ncbi:U1-C, C2H2-type zinc finger [Dillenia turbinata]|uniref:U1 small nuclear ribonucleoprotein C n=1 Tax=Dillenia turbinata TaxID=194707 RepID=A0AAN8UE66_9MAGN